MILKWIPVDAFSPCVYAVTAAFRWRNVTIAKTIYEKNGRLTGLIIDEAHDSPSSSAFQSRFGSLLRAYTLVGYMPDIFEMGFDMATALLASRYFDHYLWRAAHNSRQFGPRCLAGGRPVAGIERTSGWPCGSWI